MKTITIKGKPYTLVAERLKEFRKNKDYDNWTIGTEVLNVTPEYVVMKATVYNPEGKTRAIGHACEHREGHINKTSYVENCETSAIGRALAMLGIGVIDDIASGDEVALARDAEPDQINYIETLLNTCSLDEQQRKNVEDELVTLTYARAEKCIAYLLANQRDKIDSGDNYSQTDIQKKLNKLDA